MRLRAEDWNREVVGFLRRNQILSVRRAKPARPLHAWLTRCTWSPEEEWFDVRIQPGTLNGFCARVPIDGVWVDLSDEPRPVVPVAIEAFRPGTFAENPWLAERYGTDLPTAEYRLTETGATSARLSAITADGTPQIRTAADVRQVRTATVSVVQPIPTVRAEIDAVAAALGDPDAGRLILAEPVETWAKITIGAGEPPKVASVWAGVAGLEGLAGEAAEQEAALVQPLSRIWIVSPPGDEGEPNATWTVHVEQLCFRPLMAGVRLPMLEASPRGGLRLPPLIGGNDMIQALLEDQARRGSLTTGEGARVTGKIWTV